MNLKLNLQFLLLEFSKIHSSIPYVTLRNFTLTDSTVEEFLFNFLLKYNNIYLTVNEKNEIITETFRSRSLIEVYNLCNKYFTKSFISLSIKDFLVAVCNVAQRINKETEYKLILTHCCSIKRDIFLLVKKDVDYKTKYFIPVELESETKDLLPNINSDIIGYYHQYIGLFWYFMLQPPILKELLKK